MSNWTENICIDRPHNCLHGDKCPNNTECCFERDTPSGVKGPHGTCVARGSCNFTTGHPTNKTNHKCPYTNPVEGYHEGDVTLKGQCTEWKYVALILGLIILILGGGIVYLGIKYSKE